MWLKDTCIVLDPPKEPYSAVSEVFLCTICVAGMLKCLYILIQESLNLINCMLAGSRWDGYSVPFQFFAIQPFCLLSRRSPVSVSVLDLARLHGPHSSIRLEMWWIPPSERGSWKMARPPPRPGGDRLTARNWTGVP